VNIKPAACTNSTDVNCVEVFTHYCTVYSSCVCGMRENDSFGHDIILTADVVEQLNQLSVHDVSIQFAVASPTGVGVDDHHVDHDVVDSPAGSGGGEHESASSVSSGTDKAEEVMVSSSPVYSKAEECADVDTLYQDQVDNPALQPW